jgi:MFS family permease
VIDETVVNGAQIFYSKQFGIADKTNMTNTWLLGLVNGAPYLCCAILGCWLTVPFNNWFGRRGTVFLTCLFSALACFWQAFTNTVCLYIVTLARVLLTIFSGGTCLLLVLPSVSA